MIPAIPTTYSGVKMRSRLEARWAAFFDRMGWSWQYEPIDLAGYIPDFILAWTVPPTKSRLDLCEDYHEPRGPLLVEVRPILGLASSQWQETASRIDRSGWAGEALVVGAALFAGGDTAKVAWGDDVVVGWYRSMGCWAWGAIGSCYSEEHTTVIHTEQSFACPRCGSYDGGRGPDRDMRILAAWIGAGNQVQWRSGGA